MKTCPQCDSGYPDSQNTCPTHGLPLNEIRDLKPGMVIRNTYRILRKLGQGGMGAVYLAQHTLMNEPQALKFLSSELSQDEAFTARFLREVRTLRQIRHKNVVDAGNLEPAEDGTLFFSMEFVDGPDLRAFLNSLKGMDFSLKGTGFSPYIETPNETGPLGPEGSLPVELALSIARQIAEGLGAAHSKGMVHRDIKPENILMARDGDAWLPKIADFGIVATKESSTAYTRTGGTLLTMNYAAPEQWRGTPAAQLDGRTDLYALGGLLYEMLTGQTPFHAENYEGWSHQHQTTPPQPPSTLRPDLANWHGLDALLLRLLAKDRNDRPKDVAELLGLLDAVRLIPTEARRETVREDTAMDATHAFAKNNPKPLIRSGSRWVVAAVSMLLVALLVFALSRLKTSNEPTDQKPTPGFIPDPDQKPSPKPDADKWEQYIVAWTDPTTGLMWTKKDNAREVNWQQATNYCRNLQLAGHSGWRLPTIDELQGIYDANANVGGYHVKGSLQLSNWFQWSSSRGKASGEVWGLYFTDGSRSSDPLGISTNGRALCVRGSTNQSGSSSAKPAPVVPATIRGGGAEVEALTWTDPVTRLMWAKKDNGSDDSWHQAMVYCQSNQWAGYSDWRLPSINELQGIYDESVNSPGMWNGSPDTWHVKGNLYLTGWQWSSTETVPNRAAWNFFFGNGSHGSIDFSDSGNGRALCVRRSQE